MKGYVKSSRHYHDAVVAGRGGAAYDEVVAITARYTNAPPAVIALGFPYQDRNGRLWVEDIGRQMVWWQRHGFIKSTIPLKDIVDSSFVEAAVKAVGE
jgi:ABC-type nitrate/sulfonate/bicarbonate transport system substrate-binding protein